MMVLVLLLSDHSTVEKNVDLCKYTLATGQPVGPSLICFSYVTDVSHPQGTGYVSFIQKVETKNTI